MFILSVFIYEPDKPPGLFSRVFTDDETGQAAEAFEFYARQPFHTVSLDNVRGQEITTWLRAIQPPYNEA